MEIAVVGVTGLVGRKILDVLHERGFPVSKLYPVASEKSAGKKIEFKGRSLTLISLKEAVARKPAIAIFSAGKEVSLDWAPVFAKHGTTVIDNSSAWRMEPDKKLIVPEINATELTPNDKVIANPNCSTIQLVVALNLLHKHYGIKRLVISTYQSVTGTGVKALQQLENERNCITGEKAYPHRIDKNCIPHCDMFMENGYTREEMKLERETQKILNDNSIRITATAVRIPVTGGHSESVNIEFEQDFNLADVRKLLTLSPGVTIIDNIDKNEYPTPQMSHEKDDVFVGRIRRDFSNSKSLNMWIVSDNLRKGAATNAIQIAEFLVKNKLV